MNLAEVKKLKVAELRAKLQELGLDTKGLKADLVQRLMSAIEAESQAASPVEVGDKDGPPAADEVQQLQQDDHASELPTSAGEIVAQTSCRSPAGPEELTNKEDAEVDRRELTRLCETAIAAGSSETKQAISPRAPPASELATDHPTLPLLTQENTNTAPVLEETPACLSKPVHREPSAVAKPVLSVDAPSLSHVKEASRKAESVSFSGSTFVEAKFRQEKPKPHQKNTEQFLQHSAEGPNDQAPGPDIGVSVAPTKSTHPQSETKEQTLTTVTSKQGPTEEPESTISASVIVPQGKLGTKKDDLNGSTRVKSQAGTASDNGAEADWSMVAERGSDDETGSEPEKQVSKGTEAEGKNERGHRGVKRPHVERARGYYEFKEEINYNRAKSPEPPSEVEDEKEVDLELVQLDSYNCDLHFEVGQDGCSGKPMFSEKFPLLWSGCRLSHGFTQGSVGFEAKLVQKLPAAHLNTGDPGTHVLRVGWSLDNSSFQLGEAELSYGYDGRGKKVTGGREEDFGEPFSEGDVIGCYAFSTDGEVELSFHKNGCPLGAAFSISLALLAGRALHPHVLCKNVGVALNLDPAGSPWFPGPPGHTPFPALAPELRVRAPLPPVSKQQCEVLMMVGMPGAGKSHWAQAQMALNPEKRYNILSTHTVLRCMRNAPESEQKDQVIQQATQCVSQLIKEAARRRRNYILDQTNVYTSAQKWKRGGARHKVKVSFTLPQEGDFLEEVLFPEMSREETEKLLSGYKEEARRLLPCPPKRKRHSNNRKNAARQPRRSHQDWGYGEPRGGHSQRPYGHQPYWGPPHREDYRPFYNQYRMEYDPFYSRNYDPQRYRDYYQQYTGGDQFENLDKHTQWGIDFLERYAKFVKERLEIEQTYAKQLRNLVKKYCPKRSKDEEPRFSSCLSFYAILNELNDFAGQREIVAEEMGHKVYGELMRYSQDLKSERKHHLQEGRKAQQYLDHCWKQMDNSKKKFERECREAEKSQISYERLDNDINATKSEVEKAKSQLYLRTHMADESKNEYAAQLQTFNKEQWKHFNVAIPQIFKNLQDMDERRTVKLGDTYRSFAEVERRVVPIVSKCLDGMVAAAKSVDERRDSGIVVESFKSGFEPPGDFPFEDFSQNIYRTGSDGTISTPKNEAVRPDPKHSMGKAKNKLWLFGKKPKAPTLEDFSHLPPEQRRKRLQQRIDELSKELQKEVDQRDALNKMKDVYEKNPQMGDPGSLQPKISETMCNMERLRSEIHKNESWLSEVEGKHSSRGDRRPSAEVNHHAPHGRESPEGSYTDDPSQEHRSPPQPDPHEFDDEFDDDDPLPAIGHCKALYAFDGQNEGTLVMKEDEVLYIIEEDKGDGWTRARKQSGEEGYVPTSYVEITLEKNSKGS